MSLHEEVERFKRWAMPYPAEPRFGEWECDYEDWPDLWAAATATMKAVAPEDLTEENIADILYAVARDNEDEYLVREIEEHVPLLLHLARHAVDAAETDAKWQLAERLGALVERREEAESILLLFAYDEDEYVRRRSLIALGRLGSDRTEPLAELAWESGDEYQRMAALTALNAVGSEKLDEYLRKAEEDGREFLLNIARNVRRDVRCGVRPRNRN